MGLRGRAFSSSWEQHTHTHTLYLAVVDLEHLQRTLKRSWPFFFACTTSRVRVSLLIFSVYALYKAIKVRSYTHAPFYCNFDYDDDACFSPSSPINSLFSNQYIYAHNPCMLLLALYVYVEAHIRSCDAHACMTSYEAL